MKHKLIRNWNDTLILWRSAIKSFSPLRLSNSRPLRRWSKYISCSYLGDTLYLQHNIAFTCLFNSETTNTFTYKQLKENLSKPCPFGIWFTLTLSTLPALNAPGCTEPGPTRSCSNPCSLRVLLLHPGLQHEAQKGAGSRGTPGTGCSPGQSGRLLSLKRGWEPLSYYED